MMSAQTLRMFQALEQSCGYERAPITDAPLREQKPDSLPANAAQLLREVLTGEHVAALPSNATQRMRLALGGHA